MVIHIVYMQYNLLYKSSFTVMMMPLEANPKQVFTVFMLIAPTIIDKNC